VVGQVAVVVLRGQESKSAASAGTVVVAADLGLVAVGSAEPVVLVVQALAEAPRLVQPAEELAVLVEPLVGHTPLERVQVRVVAGSATEHPDSGSDLELAQELPVEQVVGLPEAPVRLEVAVELG
jgi:hypothetical protein